MAKYGNSKYASGFKYGELSAVSAYYNAHIVASEYDYGQVKITWTNITPDPTDPLPTYWMLVKSYAGTLDNPYDGVMIAGGSYATFSNQFIDANYNPVDVEASYSIWVFNGLRWIFCGADYAVIVGYRDTLSMVSSWIPKAWTNEVNSIADSTGETEATDFNKVLGAFCFVYDLFRVEAKLLGLVNNHSYTPSSILAHKVKDFGFSYEPSLGDSYHRSLVNAGFLVSKYKGTPLGIKLYADALTHLTSTVSVGTNLFLDYNDSSFEESVGRWVTSGGTFTQQLYANALSTYGISLPTPTLYIYDHLFPPRSSGFASLVITGIATPVTTTLTLPSTASSTNIINYAIPVSSNTRYVFSGWLRHLNSSGATATATISWYDVNGALISTTAAGATTTTSSSSWTEITSKSDTGRNGQLSPAKSFYAVVKINILPSTTSTTTIFLDMFQLAVYTDSFEFEDARRIRVYLEGESENLIPNPSFENGVGGWITSPNSSFAQDPTIYNTAIWSGSCVGELTIQSGTGGWISSPWFVVNPGENYTFSAYVSTEYPAAGRVIARIEYSNRETIELQSTILTDSNGQYYDPQIYSADSTAVTLVANSVLDGSGNPIVDTLAPQGSGPNYYPTTNGYLIQYVPVQSRVSVSAIAPYGIPDSGTPLAKVSLYFPDIPTGNTVWVDGVMFQDSITVNPYFDGSGAPVPANPTTSQFFNTADCLWEYKNIINYVQNPSFELGTGGVPSLWNTTTGITLTQDAGPGAGADRPVLSNGTYANYVNAPIFYYPKYGSNFGKISIPTVTITGITVSSGSVIYRYTATSQVFAVGESVNIWGNVPTAYNLNAQTITAVATVTAGSVYSFTISNSATGTFVSGGTAQLNGGSISTTVYLSSPAVGGEDFVVSAEVRAWEGVYTISTTGSGYTASNFMEVYQHDQYQWIRIHSVRQLVPGETSFTLTINVAPPLPFYPGGAPGYTLPTTTYVHIDGVQAEYGTTPSAFTNTALSAVTSMPNPGNPSTNMWLAQIQSTAGGKSNYINNYSTKLARLTQSLPLVMPAGSSWCVKPGMPTLTYPDLTASLIPSASFERDLGSWAGVNSTISRVVSRGSYFGDNLTHGSAYCLVKTSGTGTSTKTFGITSGHIPVVPGTGYYASVALRPANTDSIGQYTLTVNFYDANGVLIPATTGTRSVTANITQTNRWAYLANTFSAATTVNASYAIYSISYTPSAFYADQAFGIDRCVFRQ